jgi:hypothetical protein
VELDLNPARQSGDHNGRNVCQKLHEAGEALRPSSTLQR